MGWLMQIALACWVDVSFYLLDKFYMAKCLHMWDVTRIGMHAWLISDMRKARAHLQSIGLHVT